MAKLLAIIIRQIEVIFAELLALTGSPACVLFAVFFSFDRNFVCVRLDSVEDGVIRSPNILDRTDIMSGSGYWLYGFYTKINVNIGCALSESFLSNLPFLAGALCG